MGETTQKPSPHAEGLARHYWDGANRGQLVLQRCTGCGKVRHYPQVCCADCFSTDHDWVEASGLGRVHSWTVTHHAFHLGFAGDLPYALVTVDLEEGVRALGRLDGMDFADLSIGLAVRATFPRGGDGFGRLTFVPA